MLLGALALLYERGVHEILRQLHQPKTRKL